MWGRGQLEMLKKRENRLKGKVEKKKRINQVSCFRHLSLKLCLTCLPFSEETTTAPLQLSDSTRSCRHGPTEYFQLQEEANAPNWANEKLSAGFFIAELEIYAYGQREDILSKKSDLKKWLPGDRKPIQ